MSLLPPLDAFLTFRTPPGGEAEDDVYRSWAEVKAGGMIPLRTVITTCDGVVMNSSKYYRAVSKSKESIQFLEFEIRFIC